MAEGGGLLNRYTVNSRIVGSNPIPSANPLFSAVSAYLRSAPKPARFRHIAFLAVSRHMLLSHRTWGNRMGKREPFAFPETGSRNGADR